MRCLRLRLPLAAEDRVCALLSEAGSLGLRLLDEPADQKLIEAYFPPEPFPLPAADTLRELGAQLLGVRAHEARDWLAQYRAQAQPFAVGSRFVVDPRDVDIETSPAEPTQVPVTGQDPATSSALEQRADPSSRRLLHIPARNAFGTGSHESTRLAVELLEATSVDGQHVLDVGTGSGILAFAALALGARKVTALDLDLPSVITARSNARRNALYASFFAGRLTALRSASRGRDGRIAFDLALVNILPERILGELPHLIGLVHPGGHILSSGNLLERRDELLGVFEGHGLRLVQDRVLDEWVAFLLQV